MAPVQPPPKRPDEKPDPAAADARQHAMDQGVEDLEPLPTPVRIVLYFLGWLLLIVGLLGLVLPGIQGVLTMVLGAAVLSLASEAAHRRMRSLLRHWPGGRRRLDSFRARLHRFLSRRR